MNETNNSATATPTKKGFTIWQVSTFLLLAIMITAGLSYWLFNSVLFPKKFDPVVLDSKEQQVLDQKLTQFERFQPQAKRLAQRQRLQGKGESRNESSNDMTPEAYSEEGASREIKLTEKELNALLANSTDLASRLAIDLADNLASAKLLIHLDDDFPFLGGKTVKISAGSELSFTNGRPVVILRGISVWGVPIPNAWLGGLKHVDLIEEFGQDPGFWKAFSDGIDAIEVKQGELLVRLKE